MILGLCTRSPNYGSGSLRESEPDIQNIQWAVPFQIKLEVLTHLDPGYQRFFLACDGELRFVGRRPTRVWPKTRAATLFARVTF